MRFADIPQFTHANWACDYELHRVWGAIEKWRSEDGLQINPDFQRAHVWKPAQQTAFIEFMLRGGITGRDLYFNHPGWMRDWKGEFVMVDGKQRLEAIRRFFHNEIPAFGSLFKDFNCACNRVAGSHGAPVPRHRHANRQPSLQSRIGEKMKQILTTIIIIVHVIVLLAAMGLLCHAITMPIASHHYRAALEKK